MPDPDWLRAGYEDTQGRARRIAVASSEKALSDYAGKIGKTIEQTHQTTQTAMMRSGSATKAKQVTRFYGLMSA